MEGTACLSASTERQYTGYTVSYTHLRQHAFFIYDLYHRVEFWGGNMKHIDQFSLTHPQVLQVGRNGKYSIASHNTVRPSFFFAPEMCSSKTLQTSIPLYFAYSDKSLTCLSAVSYTHLHRDCVRQVIL